MGREWQGRETLGVHDPLLGADSVNNGLKAGFERGFYSLHLFSSPGKQPVRVGKMPLKPGRAAREEKSIHNWKLV